MEPCSRCGTTTDVSVSGTPLCPPCADKMEHHPSRVFVLNSPVVMPGARYLVNLPIDGIRIQDGRHEEVHLEAGAVFTVVPKVARHSHLIEAMWDGDYILVFTEDLDNNCEKILG
jgi:hypothetical protein